MSTTGKWNKDQGTTWAVTDSTGVNGLRAHLPQYHN